MQAFILRVCGALHSYNPHYHVTNAGNIRCSCLTNVLLSVSFCALYLHRQFLWEDLLKDVYLKDQEGDRVNINVCFREISCEDLRRVEPARDQVQ